MKAIRCAVLAVGALGLVACGQAASPFEGDWEVSGSDWFSANGAKPALSTGRPLGGPLGPRIDVSPIDVLPVPAAGLETAWVMPSFGTRSIAKGKTSDLVIRLSQCEVPAEIEGDTAVIRRGFSCQQRIGAETVQRTFTSGTLSIERGRMTFTATGTFTQLMNGSMLVGSFALNETFRAHR
jgi:hypothetical protein